MTFNTDTWTSIEHTPAYVIDMYRTLAAIALIGFVAFGVLTIGTGSDMFGLAAFFCMAVWVVLGLMIRRTKRLEIKPI